MIQLSDWELIQLYYEGKDEPVGIWIDRHYGYFIFKGYQKYPVRATVEDAIQDVAQKMIGDKTETRRQKFKPANKNIKGAIWMRVKNRIIDLYRAEHRVVTVSITEQHDVAEEQQDHSLQEWFEEKRAILMNYKSQLPLDEQRFLDLMFLHGFGKLKPIVDQLGITAKEGRTIKQRIVRKISRSILNNQK
jgi:RNA polymerase sigma factor, sigma-70 family